MYIFRALIMLMGIIKKPALNMYWSRDPLIQTVIFSQCMSLVRFQNILASLHFTHDDDNISDKLKKIRPVSDYLINKFQTIYRPSENICIDESLMQWHGRLSFKQFNRNKRARFGIKIYETCDSKSGYVYNFKIYTGKDNVSSDKNSLLGVSGTVVLELLVGLIGTGRSLFIDNWYSSPYLFKKLHDEKVNVCGTVRLNRKHMPKVNQKTIKRGEMQIWKTSKMCFIAWRDKKLITMLSTMHSPQMIPTSKTDRRSGEIISKPNIVISYNNNMGGVDLLDQSICPYKSSRKSVKWYIKLYFHLIDIAVFNSFVVYNALHPNNKKKLLEYRLEIVRKIIESHLKNKNSLRGRYYP